MRNGIQISHDLDAVILEESTTKFYRQLENQESKESAVSSDRPMLAYLLFGLEARGGYGKLGRKVRKLGATEARCHARGMRCGCGS